MRPPQPSPGRLCVAQRGSTVCTSTPASTTGGAAGGAAGRAAAGAVCRAARGATGGAARAAWHGMKVYGPALRGQHGGRLRQRRRGLHGTTTTPSTPRSNLACVHRCLVHPGLTWFAYTCEGRRGVHGASDAVRHEHVHGGQRIRSTDTVLTADGGDDGQRIRSTGGSPRSNGMTTDGRPTNTVDGRFSGLRGRRHGAR